MLGRHLYWIWEAFAALNVRRPIAGMGEPTYIPFSEIDAYCRFKGIFLPSERERLFRMIDRLDHEWMKDHAERREKESKTTPTPTSGSSPKRS